MIVVKQEILDQLKGHVKAKGRLSYEFVRTTRTIDLWIHNNDPMLTTPTATRAIAEELGVEESEITEEQELS
jgi:DNA-directed RNA polymerase specialized sigma subunit